MSALSGVVAVYLKDNSYNPTCLLNLDGQVRNVDASSDCRRRLTCSPVHQVCTFAYITTGVTLLISCGIAFGFLAVEYTLIKPVHDVAVGECCLARSSLVLASHSFCVHPVVRCPGSNLFLAFWQFVMSLTIQIRGNQATDAGFPGTSARKAAYALAWTSMSMSIIGALSTCLLMYLARPKRKRKIRAGAPGTPSAVPNQSFFGNTRSSSQR